MPIEGGRHSLPPVIFQLFAESSGLLSEQVSVEIQRVHSWRINFYCLILGEELAWGSPPGKSSKG